MRQLCCHPQISARDRQALGDETQTLDQIRVRLVDNHVKALEQGKKDLKKAEEALETFERSDKARLIRRATKNAYERRHDHRCWCFG